MKIESVKIENFRNIKSLQFNVDNATIISGENELGKSNALNALVWFFTDTIYTDNSGVGENDINSIVPKNQLKGEHTSVSITFVDGPTFTKVYKTGYDRATGKPNKHTTEGMINSVGCKNMNEWNTKLMDALGFAPTFTSVKELNLFVDPLYALQKLDAKQLRTLLVSFGCTATNEEMYKLGFEDLRQYEKKYLGDFVNMRLDLKKNLKVINETVNKYQILVEQFNEIAEFDNSKIDEVKSELDELKAKKNSLKSGGNAEALKELEYQLKGTTLKAQTERERTINDIKLSIKEQESKKELIIEQLENERASETLEYKNEINRLNVEINSAKVSIGAYNKSLDTLRSNLKTTQTAANNIVSKKSDYQAKLVAAKERVFTDFVVCPCCGASFATDENAEANFNAHKDQDIKFYTEQIGQFNKDIKKYQEECNGIVQNADTTKCEIANLENMIIEMNKTLEANKKALNEIESIPMDGTKINQINADITELKSQLYNVEPIEANTSIIELKAKINEIKSANESAYLKQSNDLETLILDAESRLEDLYIERSNWETKLEHQANLKKAIAQFNDTESLIQRVNDFIHAMIKLINDKAKAKTGMDFVMLEENLGNDGVKEVCYAVVDGVPFSMINTAKKYIYGIKFIEKVKDIAVNDFNKSRNDLPILADKFEGIDHIEKIKTLSSEQLICTRVGLENKITIL